MTTIVGIAGSLRRASTNRGLLRAAQAALPEGVSMEIADLTDIPFYNADITEKPASVQRVFAQLAQADALVRAVAHGVPGAVVLLSCHESASLAAALLHSNQRTANGEHRPGRASRRGNTEE